MQGWSLDELDITQREMATMHGACHHDTEHTGTFTITFGKCQKDTGHEKGKRAKGKGAILHVVGMVMSDP